jgi:L-threonylcarbamoyladenylate synthase
MTERLNAGRTEDVARAAEMLRGGATVAFPTETVYGLGANALSPAAVGKIFIAKDRPHWDPLIVHVSDRKMAEQIASISPGADKLMDRFWPGPLTLLLPRTSAISNAITGGRPLVGVRMPSHPVALELIRQAGVPVAAPSANRFGHTSPTTAAHVLDDLDDRIDALLDSGPCEVGVESTVAELTHDGVVVYRPGAVDLDMIASIHDIGWVRMYEPPPAGTVLPGGLPSPGFGLRHYAPRARLLLVSGLTPDALARARRPIEQSLVDAIDKAFRTDGKLGVMLPDGWEASYAEAVYHWGPWKDPEILARRLFAGLRHLDGAGATVIVCPLPELPGIGEAIRDRLLKAAQEK